MLFPRQPAGRLHERLAFAIVLTGIAAAIACQPVSAAPASPDGGASRPTAQAVLFEESRDDPQGNRLIGSVTWRTEMLTPALRAAPELAVRGDIEIPDRQMVVTWTMRRNTDKSLPASHTVEITFKLPADFPGGDIDNVPGLLMKTAEAARGTPLAGLAVKITSGFFIVGLSAGDAERTSNMRLLEDREWFDVPMIYKSGRRAILALEKGPSGDQAFADAFAEWAKSP